MLLIRPAPQPSESARGYLLRLADGNGLESPRWFAYWVGQQGAASSAHENLTRLLGRALTGTRGPIANLAPLNAPDPGSLPMRYWNTRRPRFCPHCLEESGHWHGHWDIIFTTACVRHGVRLLDCCPDCGAALAWDRPHLTQCACGFDLATAATSAATPAELALSGEIEAHLLSEVSASPWARGLSLEALLRLVWFLGAYGRNAHAKPQKVVGLETVSVAAAMAAEAMAVLLNWPQGFHDLLARIDQRRQGQTSGNKLSGRFGSFYRALYKSFSGARYDFLREGFEHYVQEHWTGQLAARNRRLSTALRSRYEWISVVEAARLLKVGADKVKRYLADGTLTGELHTTTSGRKMSAVRRESVEALLQRGQDRLTLKEARTLLGISRKKAYALLDAGMLKPVSGPAVDGRAVWAFERAHVLDVERHFQGTSWDGWA